ncbi:MAG TPA: hypothetical protein VEL28_23020 [Candidatus Binatia bacterium]|nr:hypothetical protein [Candidatus Binatia bacterium]
MLIVWNRIFGTFEPEVGPVTYGLTRNIEAFRPLQIALPCTNGRRSRATSRASAHGATPPATSCSRDGARTAAPGPPTRFKSDPITPTVSQLAALNQLSIYFEAPAPRLMLDQAVTKIGAPRLDLGGLAL